MPQSLVLENKLGEFIANETSNFVDNVLANVDYGSGSTFFDFYAYNALDAIYSTQCRGVMTVFRWEREIESAKDMVLEKGH